MPRDILATFSGGWKSSPSTNAHPRSRARPLAAAVLPEPDTPITTRPVGWIDASATPVMMPGHGCTSLLPGIQPFVQPLWYHNAVIYQIDVAMFLDTNDDGIGDLRGTTERLEHVRGLGANAIWLLPFYRSPYRDGGYDVIDHLTVDPRFGDNADIAHLLNEADSLGLRVILDLVAQHTSIDHPWFQEARHDRSSQYRDYYVWRDEPEESELSPVFPTEEDSIWTWDEEAQQFYRHVFYSHEPDLDLGNPAVREELYRVMEYWLRMGVSGFRVDAAPFMVERA